MRKFNREDAEEILRPCAVDKYIECKDDGVWPAVQRDLSMVAETELLRWRPARELQDLPDAPKVADTPLLPFPFTANDLAAFLLKGVGALVGEFYGDWHDRPEPDPQMLLHIDPDTEGRRALMDAYAAYKAAKLLVPAGPNGAVNVGAMVCHLLASTVDFSDSARTTKTKPLQRSAAQDSAVLQAIRDLGYDPKNLPANPAGKPGVKAAVQQILLNDRLFSGPTIFKKTWERLRAREDIVTLRRVSP